MKNNKSGFTLIELLAVIVILGIVMAIVSANVLPFIEDARKGSLASTATAIVDAAANLFVIDSMSNGSNVSNARVIYLIDDLVPYLENVTEDSYEGCVDIQESTTKGTYIYTIYLYDAANGYYIEGVSTTVVADDVLEITENAGNEVSSNCFITE